MAVGPVSEQVECPLCGQSIDGLEAPAPGEPTAIDGMPLSEKLHRLVDVLLRGDPQMLGGNTASALAIVRVVARTPLVKPLTGSLPPIDDEQAWLELITLVVGVLGALPEQPIDYDSARQMGALLVAGVIA